MDQFRPYIGRYAPSPTGRLHQGNLMAAALSWADARAHNGVFRLRMEDLDTPRNVPGSSESILKDMEAMGLDWDGPVVYQSERLGLYDDALAALVAEGLAFPCVCSRRDIREALSQEERLGGKDIYPGTCRLNPPDTSLAGVELSWRLHIPEDLPPEVIEDRRLGTWTEDLAAIVGDYVLKRKDGIMAYQLACVVDDIEMSMTDIVRGEDLAGSCGRQQALTRLLGGRPSRWLHLPLVLGDDGEKISKRHRTWDDTPLDGPQALGTIASQLGWLPMGERIRAHEFLALYKAKGWAPPLEERAL